MSQGRKRRVRTSPSLRHADSGSGTCPVCGECVKGSLDDLEQHVDKCLGDGEDDGDVQDDWKRQRLDETPGLADIEAALAAREQDEDSNADSGYTWNGEHRVRSADLLEASWEQVLGGNISKGGDGSDEVDGDVDVDDDGTTRYGEAQFTEQDLQSTQSTGTDEVHGLNTSSTSSSSSTTTTNDVEGTVHGESMPLPSQELLVQVLRDEVRRLKGEADEIPRCLVCMGLYKEATVSIGCWHVYCAQCWLSTLRAKRVCPQCQVITLPSDLRRVYL